MRLESSGSAAGSQYWNLKCAPTTTVSVSGMNQHKITNAKCLSLPFRIAQMEVPKAVSKKSALPK